MSLDDGRHLLDLLARRWRRRTLAVRCLAVVAAVLPLAAVIAVVFGVSLTALAIDLGVVLAVVVAHHSLRRRPLSGELARHLDRTLPQLEDSSDLLLDGRRELTLLERLQRRRVLRALAQIDGDELLPWRPVISAGRWLVLSAAASAAVWLWAPASVSRTVEDGPGLTTTPSAVVEEVPVLRALDVTIEPPAYTGRPARSAQSLDLEAEEGGRVRWTVTAAPEVDRASLVFDHMTVDLEKLEGVFATAAEVDLAHLYYLRLESAGEEVFRSPYARLDVISDAPPSVDVLDLQPLTELEKAEDLTLRAEARDDYRLTETAIRATLAAGSGEMVEFREERFGFTSRESLAGGGVRLGRRLDLAALGMEPGTELYFFVEAFDNRHPKKNRSRTPTYVVRVPGGRGLSVGLGDGIPMLTLPEYFRSQRQIIIDTEKLIAERGTITEKEFKQRGQDLGLDQGALRMRYGVLLGLEFEDGAPVAEDEEEGHEEEEIEFESESIAIALEELPEGLAHSHDSIESATFFTSGVKTILKAAIRQMWESELHLRLFDPDAALPYEYRALRLLKEVQQAERVYVQRIGFDAPLVKPDEKRLTGDLEKIASQRHRFKATAEMSAPEARRALEILDAWQGAPAAVPDGFTAAMTAASSALARRAAAEPDFDLEALEHLRGWIAKGRPAADEVEAVERSLWRLLPEPSARPARRPAAPDTLYGRYRDRLAAADGGER